MKYTYFPQKSYHKMNGGEVVKHFDWVTVLFWIAGLMVGTVISTLIMLRVG